MTVPQNTASALGWGWNNSVVSFSDFYLAKGAFDFNDELEMRITLQNKWTKYITYDISVYTYSSPVSGLNSWSSHSIFDGCNRARIDAGKTKTIVIPNILKNVEASDFGVSENTYMVKRTTWGKFIINITVYHGSSLSEYEFDLLRDQACVETFILTNKDNPTIGNTLSIQRTPNDESSAINFTGRIFGNDGFLNHLNYEYEAFLAIGESSINPNEVEEWINMNNLIQGFTIENFASGLYETIPVVLEDVICDPDKNYDFYLLVTNGIESLLVGTTVSDSFANVHLSEAKNGGVAFGKFSSATDNNPLFECEYPAIFGGGIMPGFVEVIPLTLDGNFRDYTDGSSPRLYRFGNLVCLMGVSSPTRSLTVSSTSQNYPMFTIPEGLRPATNIAVKNVGSSTTTWVLTIDPETGVCNACRNIGTGGYTNFSAGNWMPYNVMWIIE